jgi:hypothetical protein
MEGQPDIPREATGTISVFTQSFPRIGAAAVRNHLAREARGDMLIFGNADARPMPDMVQRHADIMASLPPGSLVVGSAPWESSPQPSVFEVLLHESPMIFTYCDMVPRNWYDFRHAWTVNLAVRRQEFIAAGGFHDELRPVFFEDLAFAYRMIGPRSGVWYEPEARVTHRHPMTLDEYLDREELLGIMAPVLARVYPEAFQMLFNAPNARVAAAGLEAWLQLDRGLHRYTYQELRQWESTPAAALGEGEARERYVRSLHLMHMPLKRLAFRLGFLKGLELADDRHWESRQSAVGQWRQLLL